VLLHFTRGIKLIYLISTNYFGVGLDKKFKDPEAKRYGKVLKQKRAG
jgi:hypothetical protein